MTTKAQESGELSRPHPWTATSPNFWRCSTAPVMNVVTRTSGTRTPRGELGSRAARLLADALACTRRVGATGLVSVRADSAFYGYDIVAAARRAGVSTESRWSWRAG